MSYFPISNLKVSLDVTDLAKTTGSMFTGNLVLNGGNIVTAGTETIDGRRVSADGLILDAINSGAGILARTGPNTFSQLTLVGAEGEIQVTNGNGVAGNPTIALADVGVGGTFSVVSVDSKGRVIGGSNPTTLAEYGITDALHASLLSSNNIPGTIVARDAEGNFSAGVITANLVGNAASATKLASSVLINGHAFDGASNLTLTADDLADGNVNGFFTNAKARAAISASGAISYDASTGLISFTGVSSVAGKTGNVMLSAADVGLGNVANLAQVVNAGSVPSLSSGLLANRPVVSTPGRMYLASDTMEVYRDSGASWVLMRAAYTGDVTSQAGTNVMTLSSVGTAGSYTKVTTDAKGRVIAGSSPSTLAGLGIADGVSTTGATMTGNLTLNGGNIVMAAGEKVDGRDVSADGAVLDKINTGVGLIRRNEDGSFMTLDVATEPDQISYQFDPLVSPNPVLGIATDAVMPGNGGVTLPSGTTAQRPSAPNQGVYRYNTDNGTPETFTGSRWVDFITDADNRFNDATAIIVKKNPGKGQFATVCEAIDYINAQVAVPSPTNLYVIKVSAGVYVEPETVVVPPYVHVVGAAQGAVTFKPATNMQNVFSLTGRCSLNNLSINDAGENFAGILVKDINDWALIHKVETNDCYFGIDMTAVNGTTALYIESSAINGGRIGLNTTVDKFAEVSKSIFVNADNLYIFPGEDAAQECGVFATGAHTTINMRGFGLYGYKQEDGTAGLGNAMQIQDGAKISMSNGVVIDWTNGILLENVGVASSATLVGVEFKNNTTHDLSIEHPEATGSFFGVADRTKVHADFDSNFSITYSDATHSGFVSVGDLYLGRKASSLTNVTDLITETATMGLISGGDIVDAGGTSVTVNPGVGYLRDVNGDVKRIEFAGGTITLPPGSAPHVYVDVMGDVKTSITEPSTLTNLVLARILVGASSILVIGDIPLRTASLGNTIETYLRNTVGPVFVSGCSISESTINPRALNITAGEYWYGTIRRQPAEQLSPVIQNGFYYGAGAGIIPVVQIPNDTYNPDNTGLKPVSAGKFIKHSIYLTGTGSRTTVLMAHAREQYDTLEEAIEAPLVKAVLDSGSTPIIGAVIMQQGVNSIQKIIDLRPRHFTSGVIQGGGGAGGVQDHGDLLGLTDDDHPQYMPTNGVRPMQGTLNMGNNALTNVTTINGVSPTAHAARHTPNGADPLPTAAPTGSLTTSSVNGEGTANTFARSDHTHSVAGLQAASTVLDKVSAITGTGNVWRAADGSWSAGPLNVDLSSQVSGNLNMIHLNGGTNASTATFLRGDGTWAVTDGVKSVNLAVSGAGLQVSGGPITTSGSITLSLSNDLKAVEDLTTTGMAVRIGTDAWVTRSITGEANQIAVTNGNGVTSNPVIGLADNPTIPGTASVTLPAGTTAQRPSTAVAGMLRYNTTTDRLESYTNLGWRSHIRQDGDSFTGAVSFGESIALNKFMDFNASGAPALPGIGTRRFYASAMGRFTTVDAVDADGLVTRLFRDSVTVVVNGTGATIPKGRLVYATGSSSGSFVVALAMSNAFATSTVLGMTAEDIVAGGSGRIFTAGKISGMNTSGLTPGAKLWLSDTEPGGYRDTRPPFPAFSHVIGNVLSSDFNNGEIHLQIKTINGAVASVTASNFTVGSTLNSSMILQPSSTAQRTFTFPNVSGTVLTTGNLPTTTVTGDVTGSGAGNVALTLATVNSAPGTFGTSTSVPTLTVNGKGLVTSVTNTAIAFPVSSVAGKTGAVTLAASDVGLNNVANSLQVINGGGVPSISAGTLAARPAAGTSGRMYVATDSNAVYRDTGTAWNLLSAAVTGDVTIPSGGTVATLANSGVTANTYGSGTSIPVITVDAKGRVTSASTAPISTDYSALSNRPKVSSAVVVQGSTTATIPFDATTPLSTEGASLVSLSITPSSASSVLSGSISASVTTSTANRTVSFTVFRDGVFVTSGFATVPTAGYMQNISVSFIDSPNTTGTVTYSVRVGASSGTTTYVNRGQTATMGGSQTAFVVQELI